MAAIEQIQQISLVSIGLNATIEPKKERGKYNKTPKIIPIDPWVKIQILYEKLAQYSPRPIMCKEEKIIETEYLKAWYVPYQPKTYIYNNHTYDGEQFETYEAEIKGTETLWIEERVYIHEQFLSLIEQGKTQGEAYNNILPIINKLKMGLRLRDVIKDISC